MSKETADKVIDLILKKEKKKLDITWFGGEPLINKDIINYICDKLKENNISIKSNIITNGILFDKELISQLKEKWNLHSAQITLDGIGTQYEKIKGVPQGSFDKVINNIEELMKAKIHVSIRMNVNTRNYKDSSELLDFIYNRFYTKYNKYFKIYIHEIFGSEFEKDLYSKIKKLAIKAE
jgi:uncharacterized protein